MKKTTFNISFDEDKAAALTLYLSQKGTTAEAELERALDVLYGKTVPAGVREFIDMRSGIASPSAVPKPRKPKSTKTEHLALSAGVPIVLVDCCDTDKNFQPIISYRWFQIPIELSINKEE